MEEGKIKRILSDPNEFFRDATDCTKDWEQIHREMQVADLKEVYDREYLLSNKLCTPEEYDTISASTFRADALKQVQDEAFLRNQVVGAEVF